MRYRVTSIKTGYDPIRSIAAEKSLLADDYGRLAPETARLQQVFRTITDTEVPDSIGYLSAHERAIVKYLLNVWGYINQIGGGDE